MNRRQTYGGMGMYNGRNNNKNLARHSIATHGVLQNNMNIGNRGNMRRSSILMQTMKMTKDPRPLKDKQWIDKQIQLLIEYLCCHGYESSMLSPKELNPPSTKNFQYICCFLFQQIDPTFNMLTNKNNNKKFEDECISFFEKLGYPFKISKSSLRCIAPHSWPPLLGAISWIIELLMFAESFDHEQNDGNQQNDVKMKNLSNNNGNNDNDDDHDDDNDDDDEINGNDADSKNAKSDRLFFNLVAENYGLWLKGSDDDDTITSRLMNVFIEQIKGLNENILTFKKANEQLITEKQRIETESPRISDLQDQRQHTIAALNEMNKVIKERDEYINTVKNKHKQWDEKVNEKIVQIQESDKKINELKQILSVQTISPKDVEIMNRESIQLSTKTDELQLQKEEIQRKQHDITANIENIYKKCKKLVIEYNDLAQKIEIIPISGRYSFGQDHILKLKDILNGNGNQNDLIISKPQDLCNQDLLNFGNNLSKLTNHFNDKIRKSQLIEKTENDKISQIKSDLEIEENKVKILNERLSNVVNLYNDEKSKMSILTASTAASIEKIELSMNSQSDEIDQDLKHKKKEFIEINNEYNKLFEECKKIEIQLTSKIGIAIQKLCKHRQIIRENLKNINQKLDDSLEKVSFYHIQEPTIHNISYYNHNQNENENDNDDNDDNDVEMENNNN